MTTMTLHEAAAALGVTPSTLRHQLRNGRLRGRKVGPVWTVSSREVARYQGASLGKVGRPRKATAPSG